MQQTQQKTRRENMNEPESLTIPAFEPDQYYSPKALGVIAAVATLARWRSQRLGPRWVKAGKGVFYKGSDITEWLEKRRRGGDPKVLGRDVADD